ncbi:hypothetical protein AMS68_002831 [Peltaster fructicola]|uniref:ASST-domain-containing protein n=1 Tax=Peltaster fructicola TaxID=286661 RepID=A0A6H0XRF7_9PEZI|nr:hypothetical protein AMS68_002831 [Peltaster fructicola]
MATHESWCSALWLILSLLFVHTSADLTNETSPTHQFKSRPDLHAPIIELTIHRPELILPGYLFLAPYRNLAPGPHIYDNYGELVWAGAGAAGPRTAHMPHVCQYKGKDHLCFFQGDQHHGYARGFGVIMDNTYKVVKTVESSGAGASSDMHEFRLTPFSDGKTALLTVYQPRPYDLTVNARFNMLEGMGFIIDGVFQEIDIETGDVLFEWRSLDHVDPSQSWIMPATTDTSGNGLDTLTAWDYFHVNSIDKNKNGDYLISSRHTSAIYKLSGRDGRILWQLGGSHSTFQSDFKFGYQHEARWVSENTTHTVLSFFDNSGNAYNYTNEHSQGVIVAIDHRANTASLIRAWGAPEPSGGLRSASQGNMQLLPNGGALICWGEHARFSEHLADGSAVMYGRLALRESNVMMYRAHKFNWTAQPTTTPTVWTFSKSGDSVSGTRFYVSWNGATEVRTWRFNTAATASGPFQAAGDTPKQGFETEYHHGEYAEWTYVDAVDEHGRVLASSGPLRTFVPSSTLVNYCDERGCQYNKAVPENFTIPYDADVQTDENYLSTNRGYRTQQYYSPRDSFSGAISKGLRGRTASFLWIAVAFVALLAALLLMRRSRPMAVVNNIMASIRAFSQLDRSARRARWTPEKDEIEMLSSSSEVYESPGRRR